MVIFAHGSGSSRFSERNRYVATTLNDARLGTLLFDLLTDTEGAIDDQTRQFRFDIPLLAHRLGQVVAWINTFEFTRGLPIGLFGASTGAAAALIAAAQRPDLVHCVVCRGGRPDLAGDALPRVKAPVLFIVGGNDSGVIELNEDAAARLTIENRIEIIPGASHLFEEEGKLDAVADQAREWFERHLHT
jgi:pimeloyl-ACP methyl ester carboxylesterase